MEQGHRAAERPLRTFVATLSLLAALLFGGMAVGFAIALGPAGGSVGAIVVGFFALPLTLGLGMSAWRGVALVWLAGNLLKAGLRSRGDEERFRTETRRSIEGLSGGLPGTWVFVPIGLAVGGVAALVMLLAATGDGIVAAAATFAACAGYGLLLRRLARSGLLPIPAE